eukprot:COSAG01_NODE_32_length_35644_cov_22.273738_18_plen_92_part_00
MWPLNGVQVGLDWPWVGSLDWLHFDPAPVVKDQPDASKSLITCAKGGQKVACTTYGTPNYNNNPTTFRCVVHATFEPHPTDKNATQRETLP